MPLMRKPVASQRSKLLIPGLYYKESLILACWRRSFLGLYFYHAHRIFGEQHHLIGTYFFASLSCLLELFYFLIWWNFGWFPNRQSNASMPILKKHIYLRRNAHKNQTMQKSWDMRRRLRRERNWKITCANLYTVGQNPKKL